MKTYIFHADPGHAWLAVKASELINLGIADKISSYSYVKGGTVYLEEDCDATAFILAYEARYGHKPAYRESYRDHTAIRSFDRYSIRWLAEQYPHFNLAA